MHVGVQVRFRQARPLPWKQCGRRPAHARPAAAGGWPERSVLGDAAQHAARAAAGGDDGTPGLQREAPLRGSRRPEPSQQQAAPLIDAASPRYRFW
jgi:hypothetical protein